LEERQDRGYYIGRGKRVKKLIVKKDGGRAYMGGKWRGKNLD